MGAWIALALCNAGVSRGETKPDWANAGTARSVVRISSGGRKSCLNTLSPHISCARARIAPTAVRGGTAVGGLAITSSAAQSVVLKVKNTAPRSSSKAWLPLGVRAAPVTGLVE
ncbi:hypothetical protein D3C76_1450980 [compost metagenome]